MKFEVWKSKGHWYWHLKAANGEIIAQGQPYKRKTDLMHCINLIRSTQMVSSEVITLH